MLIDFSLQRRPPIGSIKCNCDAALFEQEGIISMRCVLQDSQGHFLGCFASKIHGVLFLKEAEVYRLCQAIIWVIRFNLSIVRLKLDAKFVFDSFHSSRLDESEFGRAIRECRVLCQQRVFFFLYFTKRHCNKAAHVLARVLCSCISFFMILLLPLVLRMLNSLV